MAEWFSQQSSSCHDHRMTSVSEVTDGVKYQRATFPCIGVHILPCTLHYGFCKLQAPEGICHALYFNCTRQPVSIRSIMWPAYIMPRQQNLHISQLRRQRKVHVQSKSQIQPILLLVITSSRIISCSHMKTMHHHAGCVIASIILPKNYCYSTSTYALQWSWTKRWWHWP